MKKIKIKKVKFGKKIKIKNKYRKKEKGKTYNPFLKKIKKIAILIFLSLVLFLEDKYTIISSTKVGLCILCKNENLYLKEFIKHYKNLGYNHIIIYDNNDINGEKIEDVLQKEIDEGYVSVINFRGDKNRPIFRFLSDCYGKNKKKYDWISFFDVDEFLEIKPKGIKIQKFLDNKRYNYCQNIKINWVLYSDDNKLHYENKPVQKRFKTPLYDNDLNKHIKSTVRGNLPTNYWIPHCTPHSGRSNYNCCSSSGKQISKSSSFNIPYDYKYAELKHYRTKTIEEYLIKIKKGKADGKINIKEMINMFYLTNDKTKEKFEIFKKEFNLSR